MRIVVGGRAAGKSLEAVRWAAQDPGRRVVVTFNRHSAEYLARVAKARYPGLDADWTKVFVRADSTSLRGRDVDVYVDEFDAVLSNLLGARVVGATATAEVYDIGECGE